MRIQSASSMLLMLALVSLCSTITRMDAAPVPAAPALQVGAGNAPSPSLKLALLMAQSLSVQERIDTLQAIVRHLTEADDRDNAQAVLQHALNLVSKLPRLAQPDALQQLAMTFADTGNSRQAQLLMRQLPLDLRAGVLPSLILQLVREDEHDEALLLVEQADAEERPSLLQTFIEQLSEKGQFARALALIEQLPKEEEATALSDLLQNMAARGQVADAIQLAQKLPEMDRFSLFADLSQMLAEEGKDEPALALAQLLPGDDRIQTLNMLTGIYAGLGKVEPALSALAHLQGPHRRAATAQIVHTLIELGHIKSAMPMLDELHGIDRMLAHAGIARHHLRNKQPRETAAAGQQLERALADCKEHERTEAMPYLLEYHARTGDVPAVLDRLKQLPQEDRPGILLVTAELLLTDDMRAPKAAAALIEQALPMAAALRGVDHTDIMTKIVSLYARAGHTKQARAIFVQLPKESQSTCRSELLTALVEADEIDQAVALAQQGPPDADDDPMCEVIATLASAGKAAKAIQIIKPIKDETKRMDYYSIVLNELMANGRTKEALACLVPMPNADEKKELLLSLAHGITTATPRAEALEILWQSLDLLTKMSRQSRREGLQQLAPIPALLGNKPFTPEEAKIAKKISALLSAASGSK